MTREETQKHAEAARRDKLLRNTHQHRTDRESTEYPLTELETHLGSDLRSYSFSSAISSRAGSFMVSFQDTPPMTEISEGIVMEAESLRDQLYEAVEAEGQEPTLGNVLTGIRKGLYGDVVSALKLRAEQVHHLYALSAVLPDEVIEAIVNVGRDPPISLERYAYSLAPTPAGKKAIEAMEGSEKY